MKASSDQLNRIRELCAALGFDGRSLRAATGQPLSEMSREDAGRLVKVLLDADTLPRASAARHWPKWPASLVRPPPQPSQPRPKGDGLVERLTGMLGIETEHTKTCPRCKGSGEVRATRRTPTLKTLAQTLTGYTVSSGLQPATLAARLRGLKLDRLQLVATHFDGDLNQAAALAAEIAEALESGGE